LTTATYIKDDSALQERVLAAKFPSSFVTLRPLPFSSHFMTKDISTQKWHGATA